METDNLDHVYSSFRNGSQNDCDNCPHSLLHHVVNQWRLAAVLAVLV